MKIQVIITAIILLAFTNCQRKDTYWRAVFYTSALEHSLASDKVASDNWLVRLKKEVRKNGNSREGLERIKRAELLKRKTVILLGDIDKTKVFLIKERGDGLNPRTFTVKKPLANSKLRKQAKILRKDLAKHIRFLKNEYKDLNVVFEDDLSNGDAQDEERFYTIYFKGTNVVEALMSLTHLQSRVLQFERIVAKQLGPYGD
ncbi:hypothetical protein BKI52_10375 [marine bacterium AO1-C]|nr:hypothetical protein BKI52_10375 [marine bacterium AO1-C]